MLHQYRVTENRKSAGDALCVCKLHRVRRHRLMPLATTNAWQRSRPDFLRNSAPLHCWNGVATKTGTQGDMVACRLRFAVIINILCMACYIRRPPNNAKRPRRLSSLRLALRTDTDVTNFSDFAAPETNAAPSGNTSLVGCCLPAFSDANKSWIFYKQGNKNAEGTLGKLMQASRRKWQLMEGIDSKKCVLTVIVLHALPFDKHLIRYTYSNCHALSVSFEKCFLATTKTKRT